VRAGLALLILFVVAAAIPPAAAQQPSLTVTRQSDVPRIQAAGLLADGQFIALMRSGFPLRLHYRLELWRARATWFDQFVSEATWDAVARHDPIADDFVLIRAPGGTTRHASADDLARALQIPYYLTLAPRSTGRFYFLCRLEVTTLNDTDLEELTRWLKGDVSPAVSGKGNVGSALARGAQRIIERIAGLPRLTLEARSEAFSRADR
jgi:hypothetical protein